MSAIEGMACATPACDNRGKQGLNIVGHGSFATKSGRRRRYCCTVCRGTLSTNTGTAYSGLRCTRREFDKVASLRVEGVSISATARVTGHSRNTIARWLERASNLQHVASVHDVVQNLFRVGRHLLRAVHHRSLRTRSFRTWDTVTCAC